MNVKGVAKSVGGLVSGTNPSVLVDRIAERIAFERTGVRLYDGLIAKYDARGSFNGCAAKTWSCSGSRSWSTFSSFVPLWRWLAETSRR